jgi:hypothetical protein
MFEVGEGDEYSLLKTDLEAMADRNSDSQPGDGQPISSVGVLGRHFVLGI